MLPVQKILCPIDFSEASYAALKSANELAVAFNSELILLNVVESFVFPHAAGALPSFNISPYLIEMQETSKKALADIEKNKVFGGVPVRSVLVEGHPSDEIAIKADEEKVDLIVISKHGLGGWQKILFGSVAEKVIKLANCPVLLVQSKPGNS